MSASRVIIIGAGVAGASTAWHLSRPEHARGGIEVVILERDGFPGRHSSGRNAGMVRQSASSPIGPLAVTSTRWMRGVAGAAPTFRFEPTGSILLGEVSRLEEMRRDLLDAGVEPDAVSLTAAAETGAAPLLADDLNKGALSTSTDGVVDAHGLLGFFLRGAAEGGVEIRCGVGVERVAVTDGRVRGVETDQGFLAADVVVNAAGGWAGQLAPPGATDPGITPTARSVFRTGPVDGPHCNTRAFVWDIADQWYFRPESGGWLLCAGEEYDHPPGIPEPRPGIEAELRDKLARFAPPLADLPFASSWAGLRTFSRDRLPVIGRDPAIRGLVWMAGLGGHGLTVCHAAGALCAKSIIAPPGAGEDSPFDPSRFRSP